MQNKWCVCVSFLMKVSTKRNAFLRLRSPPEQPKREQKPPSAEPAWTHPQRRAVTRNPCVQADRAPLAQGARALAGPAGAARRGLTARCGMPDTRGCREHRHLWASSPRGETPSAWQADALAARPKCRCGAARNASSARPRRSREAMFSPGMARHTPRANR